MTHEGAAAEMAAIKQAIAMGDSAALEVYGGLNPALQRTRILNAICAPQAPEDCRAPRRPHRAALPLQAPVPRSPSPAGR